MNQGTLFRILILAVGLYTLSGSITGMSTSLWSLRNYQSLDPVTRDYQLSILIGYGIFPFSFASLLLLFPRKIERFFLGGQSDTVIYSGAIDQGVVVKKVIQIIGLYLFCTYGSAMSATIYEILALKSGNQQFTEEQVTADSIANGVGLALALALCFRASEVIKLYPKKSNRLEHFKYNYSRKERRDHKETKTYNSFFFCDLCVLRG